MGARRLAQTLVAQHLLSNTQVVGALQRQTLIGGSLDTNVLELQLLREDMLLAAMEHAFGAPAVGKRELDAIGIHLARLFPLAFAREYNMIPMRLEDQVLVVAGCVPPDDPKVQRIWEQYQLHLDFRVAAEVRLFGAMQRLYNEAPAPRFAQLAVLLDGWDAMQQTASPETFGLDAEAPAEPGRAAPSKSASPELGPIAAIGGATGIPDSAPGSGLDLAAGSAAGSAIGAALEEAAASLDAAPDRDRAIPIIVGFAQRLFDYVGVFMLLGKKPTAWQGRFAHPPERIDTVDAQTVKDAPLQLITLMRQTYVGALPRNPAHERFLRGLGRPYPQEAFIASICVGGRIVALVYAEPRAGQVAPESAAALATLLQRCGVAWERLILQRKRQAGGAAEAATSPESQVAPRAQAAFEAQPGHAPDAARASTPETSPARSGYVMFSDVTDTPQRSLGDWQDVFVEVSRHDGAASVPRPSKIAARWSDVIALARSAARFVPTLKHTPPPDARQVEHLLAALDSPAGATRQSALAQLLNLGPLTDAACGALFPGRLSCDIRAPDAVLPPFVRCSGLCHFLVGRGQEATAVVLPHLASEDPVKRLMAVYFFQAVHDPTGCPGLTLCLHDTEKRVRNLAIETLRHYKNDLSYAYTVQMLRQQLQDPATRNFAIRTLGQLREVFAVPALIPLVAASDQDVARAAVTALAVICGQAFGADTELWQQWWRTHHYQPRPAWLLDGLSNANPTIRRVAHQELQHITGQVLDFDPQASAREREQRAQVWQHWLQTHDLDAHWHPAKVRA